MNHDGNPTKAGPAWTGRQGRIVDGLWGGQSLVGRDQGWGRMETSSIRIWKMVGNGDGGSRTFMAVWRKEEERTVELREKEIEDRTSQDPHRAGGIRGIFDAF